jgi:uncharacterized membrane protein
MEQVPGRTLTVVIENLWVGKHMHTTLTSYLKRWLRPLVAIALVLTLTFSHADSALAAGGGRIGGGSFRAPAPSRSYSPRPVAPGGYGGGYGGGYYPGPSFPFFAPYVFVGGGGSLLTLLVFFAVAGVLVQGFRRARSGNELGYDPIDNPTISVAKLQVGLLADARELQSDLNKLALAADTSSTTGLAEVLQETTLALLRNPEYWVYGGAGVQQARLQAAEAEFNRLDLAERSKFTGETLSNVNNQLRQAPVTGTLPPSVKSTAIANREAAAPGEYIVVTLLVGAQGNLQLPAINNSDDMRQALQKLGGVASDRLLALEVLWTPQAEDDVLTSEDMLTGYPSLKLI